MTGSRRPSHTWFLALAIVGPLVLGCTRRDGPDPTSDDYPAARALLVEALDAWKTGRPTDRTAAGAPLTFEDEDARAGLALLSYEVHAPPPGWAGNAGLAATLSMRNRQGRPVLRHAEYRVSIRPDPMIRRDD